MNLSDLAKPFAQDDVEWRVARAGVGPRGIYCRVLCYITARAIQQRLDEVCGPENWRVEEPRVISINGKSAFAVGISIKTTMGEWITKWDTAEPTNIEPAKGGFSGAMKRAGAQWGIGRYLYHLDEAFAEVSEQDPGVRGWHYAKLPKEGGAYYWKEPTLPAWALPKEDTDSAVSKADLDKLKKAWRVKYAPQSTSKDAKDLLEGFGRFVRSVCGDFPIADHTTWTRAALDKCAAAIASANTTISGVASDVPFEGEG